ncbi:PREDICTED: uncharacterized protein LOC108660704 [Theobroma cacao]|uniref:Uncharacterized protein LOC108660704 n=1 Tax=Theobroma cacao TaxID=3641 RepID=A0AB32VW79_THECC|nr:PREDICTED: uncharacterized protein LOC108660704 [Theobroma cacao]
MNGSHVFSIPPANDQIRFIGRKGYPTHNVMLVCNVDMLFTFVIVGWPGTAHDTCIFSTVLEEIKNVFLHPPKVDAGYPNMKGYLGPYKGERYHIDFRGCNKLKGVKETFNHAYSSLRNVIERTIGVWKNRWHILRDIKPFSLIKQEKIIVATTALHNYIRQCGVIDEDFDKCDHNPNYISESQEERSNDEEMGSYTCRRALDDSYMGRVRNQIATALMENRNR